MKYLLIVLLLLPVTLFAQTKDPGNWSFSSSRVYTKTKFQTGAWNNELSTIQCDTVHKTIKFSGLTAPYQEWETWETSGHDMRYVKGAYYYHTADYGDIEYHPNEMVVINDPRSGTRIEYYK